MAAFSGLQSRFDHASHADGNFLGHADAQEDDQGGCDGRS